MKRKKAKSSVLMRQKPKRGRKRSLAESLKLYAAIVLAAAILGGVGYGVYRFKTQGVFVADRPDRIDWKVSIKAAEDQALPTQAMEDIVATVKKLAGDGSKRSLNRAAESVQKLDSYAQVSLIKLAPNELAVHVRRRTPAFCVQADRIRFVATDAVIYGTPDPAKADACPGPLLTGVFDDQRKFLVKSDLTLALEGEERQILREALELLKLSREKNQTFTQLSYRRYRGFFVTLAGSGAEVAVGRAPFAGKLDKLTGILTKLEAKGHVAERIELDYQGKAFIKSKKM